MLFFSDDVPTGELQGSWGWVMKVKTEGSEKRYYGRIPSTLQVRGKAISVAGGKRRFRCTSEDIGILWPALEGPRKQPFPTGLTGEAEDPAVSG